MTKLVSKPPLPVEGDDEPVPEEGEPESDPLEDDPPKPLGPPLPDESPPVLPEPSAAVAVLLSEPSVGLLLPASPKTSPEGEEVLEDAPSELSGLLVESAAGAPVSLAVASASGAPVSEEPGRPVSVPLRESVSSQSSVSSGLDAESVGEDMSLPEPPGLPEPESDPLPKLMPEPLPLNMLQNDQVSMPPLSESPEPCPEPMKGNGRSPPWGFFCPVGEELQPVLQPVLVVRPAVGDKPAMLPVSLAPLKPVSLSLAPGKPVEDESRLSVSERPVLALGKLVSVLEDEPSERPPAVGGPLASLSLERPPPVGGPPAALDESVPVKEELSDCGFCASTSVPSIA